MNAIILKNFVDKFTGTSYSEGTKANFEQERVETLSKLGYVKIIKPEKVEVAVKPKEIEKAVKVEKIEKPSGVVKSEKKAKKK